MREFTDRRDAGRRLATLLSAFRDDPTAVVLGLPRGGVPVAYEVAQALGLPLDTILVRKLGLPGREEVAMGAIAEGGVEMLDTDLIREFRVTRDELDQVRSRELEKLDHRRQHLRGSRPPLDLTGKHAIIVDDGIATGSTAAVACSAAKQLGATRVTLATPVMPHELAKPQSASQRFGTDVEVIAAVKPRVFRAVGQFYRDFTQVTDHEAQELLR